MKPVVIGLGNELMGDDAVGLIVARRVAAAAGALADVVEGGFSGLSLLDPMIDRPKAVLVDAVFTGRHAPGTIVRYRPEQLRCTGSPSPHYAGLPEVIAMARTLRMSFPDEIEIVAIEAADPHTIGAGLTASVAAAVEPATETVVGLLRQWQIEMHGQPAARPAPSGRGAQPASSGGPNTFN